MEHLEALFHTLSPGALTLVREQLFTYKGEMILHSEHLEIARCDTTMAMIDMVLKEKGE